MDALPEPKQLGRVKELVAERWGTVPLVDMLKEAVLRTGAVDAATAGAKRGDMSREDLAERLILALFAYGTNTGIRAIAGGRHSERDIRYVRSRYLTPAVARTIATQIADATFAAREHAVWGRGTTSVASDSTHFGAFDQNLFTEWHSRYGGRGVLIYWARGEEVDGDPLPADLVLGVGGRGDGRRSDPPRHHDGRAGQLHRHPRPVRDRVRRHPPARLRPAAADQTDQPRAPALRVLQAALVYVNTLMVQEVLAEPGAPQLAAEDLRGLTPLFWSHVAPYEEVRLDISQRIPLAERRPAVTT